MFDRLKSAMADMFAPVEDQDGTVTEIKTLGDLDEVFAASQNGPVLILKHSTRCPVSFGAQARVGHFIEGIKDENGELPDMYVLKVVEHRAVSNAIAERLGVEHKSPQLILIDKGEASWDASHHNITPEAIQSALQAATA